MFFFGFSAFILILWLPDGFTEFISLIGSKDADFCVTNGSSAMYYIRDSGKVEIVPSSFVPIHNFHCDFETKGCITLFKIEPWAPAYSLYHENPTLLDIRWERLPEYELPYKNRANKLKFDVLLNIYGSDEFNIPISLIGDEAHLLLCDKEDVHKANCYWFILQGWRKNNSGLRRCKAGEIVDLYPKAEDCYYVKKYLNHSEVPHFIDSTKWSHVIISREKQNLYLKTYDGFQEKTLIHFLETEETFETKYLLGHRKDQKVSLKIHANHYMLSTTPSEVIIDKYFSPLVKGFCISLLLNTCAYCAMSISFISLSNILLFEEVLQPTNGIWMEKRIIMSNTNEQYMRVKIKTLLSEGHFSRGEEFWSFDEFRECHKEEYRITPTEKNIKISKCILLSNNDIVKAEPVQDYVPGMSCASSNSVGSSCISCSILQQSAIKACTKLRICEKNVKSNICYCSPGYNGSSCSEECPANTYGYSCQKKCGFCSNKCDVSNGNCECNPHFEGPSCEMPKEAQYLLFGPNVTSSSAQSCVIKWNNDDYIGKTKPEYYIVQLKDLSTSTSSWIDYTKSFEKITSHKETVTIERLKKNHRYGIRVLIGDRSTSVKILHFQDLPFAVCKTTCNGWKEETISVETTSNSASVDIKLSDDECDYSFYTFDVLNEENELLFANETSAQHFYVEKLSAFTTYHIIFYSTLGNITRIFRTLEGVPSVVIDIKMEESTPSYMKISWKIPKEPRGEIQKYSVKYQKQRRSSCKSILPWAKPSTANTTTNSIELSNLEPYSEYKITISARNKLEQGDGVSAIFSTKGLSFIKEEENLKAINTWTEKSEIAASITFGNIQCDNLLGPIKILVKFHCTSNWCLSKGVRSESKSYEETKLVFRELQSYCTYFFNISFCREDYCQHYKNIQIETNPSTPNNLKEIIATSVGDAFIQIRWLPPYPPTGKSVVYRITTRCESCRAYHSNTISIWPSKCSIWPEYLCLEINDYIYYQSSMSIKIEGANTENYKYREIGYERVDVNETPSEKPYNLSVTLNLDNTMELFWNHPNRTNGKLYFFNISINNIYGDVFQITYSPPIWTLKYSFKVDRNLKAAEDFSLRISAVNNKYLGNPAEIHFTTYPDSPELIDSNIVITNYTYSSITFSVNITQVESGNSNLGKFLIVLINDPKSTLKDPNLDLLRNKINISSEAHQTLRVVYEMDLKKQTSNVVEFTIGDGKSLNGAHFIQENIINKPLQQAQYYNISLIFLNVYKEKYRYKVYRVSSLTDGNPNMTPFPPPSSPSSPTSPEKKEIEESSSGNAAYAFLLLLLLIPIIVGIIIKRKNIVLIRPTMSLERIMENSTPSFPQSAKEIEETIPLDNKDVVIVPKKPVMRVKPKLSLRKSTNPPNPSEDVFSNPIKMADFEEYVKESIESGELERQHALFPRGQTQPWLYGSNKANKPKNRYNNLVAYDHSRVILKKIEGDEYSDYINANYIHGYNMDRAYIATQGPRATTLNDFWRMIWQENVKHIVMLANIYEGGKKKVEQYWPNINEELTFEDIVVQYHSMELFANFEYRILHATKGDETRQIEQLHFTTWPDHGVPLYPQSLVPFLRKLLKIPLSSTSPVVVHCSAGVGRTGTILLSDMSLRMAAKIGVVDLLNNLQKLREQRANMVDNIEQYKLAHLVVLECMMGLQTSINCDDDMDKNVQRLIRDGDYKIQMNYLKETEWQDQAMKSVADFNEVLPDYPEKNRIQEIVPETQGRIFLARYPHDDESSSYINAVQVDAFRCPGRFFVTQQPMPNTVGDFWRLVVEKRINVIISLNEVDLREETCCKFWPTADEPELQPVDFILIKFNTVTALEYYDVYTLHVWMKNKRQKEKLDVEIVAFKRWPIRTETPPSCEEFLSFYEEADAISRRSTNVIVTCFDGATASGVYVALCFLIDQMKLEHVCDTCLAVRTIRHNRKQFITHENQFLFLYECAVKFINGFQSYANFQNP